MPDCGHASTETYVAPCPAGAYLTVGNRTPGVHIGLQSRIEVGAHACCRQHRSIYTARGNAGKPCGLSFAHWDNPRPYLDTLTIKIIADEEQRLAGLQSGEIDVDVTTIADTVENAKTAGLASQSQAPIFANVGMRYSMTDPALGNANLRIGACVRHEHRAGHRGVAPVRDAGDGFRARGHTSLRPGVDVPHQEPG